MEQSYNWLLNIIESCKHPFQIECCQNLINLFRQKYTLEDGFGPLYDALLASMEAKDALLTV
jgi:hypothetical protein